MILSALAWATFAAAQAPFSPSTHLAFNRPPEQIGEHCKAARSRAEMRLKEIATLPSTARTFDNTPEALDQVLWDLSDETSSDTFLKYVAVSSAAREAANDCETMLGQFGVEVFSREDLFGALSDYAAKKEPLKGSSAKLLDKQLLDFKRSGLQLPLERREALKSIRRRLVQLEADFGKNLNEVKDALPLTRQELEGLPDDYVARLPREGDLYLVSVDYPDYFPFMDNARDAAARQRLERLFNNRAAQANLPLLQEVLKLRQEAAQLLGYKNHAAYVLEERMAKNPETVTRFISRLAKKLRPLARQELKHLESLKGGPINAWDWRYYDNQVMKARDIDKEKIKEFFPMETVTLGMLAVYERLLGLKFRKLSGATWHPDVSLYEIRPAQGGEPIGYFYMDLFPRAGKYKHAAAFDIVHGRQLSDGTYQKPVSAMVANFNKPSPGKPSLLKHGAHEEVETYFHEFGHIMHQTLTKARYGRFSGSNTARDFVEAPSQMLENWVWDPEVLSSLSGHYAEPGRKLPKALLEKMIAAKNVDVGLKSLRQLFLGSVDMRYHTDAAGSIQQGTTKIWADLMASISMIPMSEGVHPEASFGHLMGYDAGYYGYMWSEVFAADMFSRFKADGLLNPAVGRRYREEILEMGSSRDESESLKRFLGREPSEAAFLRELGLK
jgi:thimet oligopeptidase